MGLRTYRYPSFTPVSYTHLGARPSLEDVRRFCREKRLRLDPDRFFDVNEARGWVTKDGEPVRDWRRYALAWDRHEPEPASPASGKDGAGRRTPSVEEVMDDYHVSREKAEGMIREGLC